MAGFLPKPPWPILQRGDPFVRGLVGAWLFNEASGTIAHDYSGYHQDATSNGSGISWAGGPWGSQSVWTNNSNNFSVANDGHIPIQAPLSVVALIIDKGTGDAHQNTWFGKGSIQTSTGYYCLSTLGFMYFGINAGTLYSTTASISDSKPHVCAFTVDSPTYNLKAYLDGKFVSTQGIAEWTFPTAATPATIGSFSANFNWGNTGQSTISAILVYNRVLSANEIAQSYQDPFRICRQRIRSWLSVQPPAGPVVKARDTAAGLEISSTIHAGQESYGVRWI